jgi:hypothetical protein
VITPPPGHGGTAIPFTVAHHSGTRVDQVFRDAQSRRTVDRCAVNASSSSSPEAATNASTQPSTSERSASKGGRTASSGSSVDTNGRPRAE